MSKLLLLYLTLITGLLFLVLPEDYTLHDFFLFSDMRLSRNAHIYFIGEKVSLIAIAYILFNEAKEYRGAIQIFFLLTVLDLADYVLTYSGVWVYIGCFPISMNVVKCLVFGVTILYTWTRTWYK